MEAMQQIRVGYVHHAPHKMTTTCGQSNLLRNCGIHILTGKKKSEKRCRDGMPKKKKKQGGEDIKMKKSLIPASKAQLWYKDVGWIRLCILTFTCISSLPCLCCFFFACCLHISFHLSFHVVYFFGDVLIFSVTYEHYVCISSATTTP